MADTIFYKIDEKNQFQTLRTRLPTEGEKKVVKLAIILESLNLYKDCNARMYYSCTDNFVVCGVEIFYSPPNQKKMMEQNCNRHVLGEGSSKLDSFENAFANLNNKRFELRKMLEEADQIFDS